MNDQVLTDMQGTELRGLSHLNIRLKLGSLAKLLDFVQNYVVFNQYTDKYQVVQKINF